MKKERYHPTIYIRWEYERDGDPYMLAYTTPKDFADTTEPVEVGVYKFVEKRRVITTVAVK